MCYIVDLDMSSAYISHHHISDIMTCLFTSNVSVLTLRELCPLWSLYICTCWNYWSWRGPGSNNSKPVLSSINGHWILIDHSMGEINFWQPRKFSPRKYRFQIWYKFWKLELHMIMKLPLYEFLAILRPLKLLKQINTYIVKIIIIN